MDNEKEIRKVERIIDEHHKSSSFIKRYKGNLHQALFDVLRVFERLEIASIVGSVEQEALGLTNADQCAFEQVHNLQDALNTAIQWIYKECSHSDQKLSMRMTNEDTLCVADFILNYADPYSVIADGFISYSRKANIGRVIGNKVVFDTDVAQLNSFINDVGERLSKDHSSLESEINGIMLSSEVQSSIASFFGTIRIDNSRMCYEIPGMVYDAVYKIGECHWKETSFLPQEWEFEGFSLEDFRQCWLVLFTLSFIHFLAKTKAELPGIVQEEGVIVQSFREFIDFLKSQTGITEERINAIVNIISYDPALRNTDIMYQPLIRIDDKVIITPTLIITSRPERNLISIIQKKSDSKYSVEVNDLEENMGKELLSALPDKTINCIGRKLGKGYPDVDFAIFDETTNAVLLCEMKWLIEADSTKEVFARQNDIDHGCNQVETIMSIAMTDPISFVKKLFGIDIQEIPDLFWCVISKHDIRSINPHVPVISLDTIKELLQKFSLSTVFHKIRNKEFYKPLPKNSSIGHKIVKYAGYEIWVPALVIENEYEI